MNYKEFLSDLWAKIPSSQLTLTDEESAKSLIYEIARQQLELNWDSWKSELIELFVSKVPDLEALLAHVPGLANKNIVFNLYEKKRKELPKVDFSNPETIQSFAKAFTGYYLTKDQLEAAIQILAWIQNPKQRWMNLRGYAGTGKTTLVQVLIKLLQNSGFNVIGLAPTHKAVQVLGSKVDCPVATVQSTAGLTLELMDDGTVKSSRIESLKLQEFDIAFLDECSMASKDAVEAVDENKGKCLILSIGDPYQFNPVNEAKISRSFRMGPKVVLREITRQAEGNPMILASKKVRLAIKASERVRESDLRKWLDSSFFIPTKKLIPKFLKLHAKGFDCRILAYRNKTVEFYNHKIHDLLYPDCETIFAVGEKVIIHAAGVSKDEFGRVVQSAIPINNSFEYIVSGIKTGLHPQFMEKCWYIDLAKDAKNSIQTTIYMPYSMDAYEAGVSRRFDEANRLDGYERKKAVTKAWEYKLGFTILRHGYASTGHKAQGSTYDYALMDFGDFSYIRETFEHGRGLYVGFTRPRHKIYFGV